MSFVSMDELRAKGRKTWLYWRGDQQSALALERLRSRHQAEVVGLLASRGPGAAGVEVSGAIPALLEEQAQSVGLPLHWVEPDAAALSSLRERATQQDVHSVAFSTVTDEQQRSRAHAFARAVGLESLFPMFGEPTSGLSTELLGAGFRSVVNRIDLQRVNRDLLGRVYSERFLAELSPERDRLGEDGAFDTFVCGGPGLLRPISPRLNDMVEASNQYRAVLGPGPRRAYGDI